MFNKWIITPQDNSHAIMQLYCFHYAGGSAQVFQDWNMKITPDVEISMIQLPGRGHRFTEPKMTRLHPLSRIVAKAILQHSSKPFAFFGHSLGALLAFETARVLRRERQIEPVRIFISATEAPHIKSISEPLSTLPKAELIKKLRELNGTPQEVLENDALLDLLLPIIRSDFELCETYEFYREPALSCPFTIYGGIYDKEVNQEKLYAWSELTASGSDFHMFAGDHFYISKMESTFLQTFSQDLLLTYSKLQNII